MINGFTAQNWKMRWAKMPAEDSYSIDEMQKIIAVADGVTRDPSEVLPDTNTLLGRIKFAWNYPRPSPASGASRTFCDVFPEAFKEVNGKDEEAIKWAFKNANQHIDRWNGWHVPGKIDYLTNDYAGCVAAAAFVNGFVAHWGYISDCGVALVDDKGNLKAKTEDLGPSKHDKAVWESPKLKGKGWAMPEARQIIRSEFRNKPSEPLSYGVLTGEPAAMDYVKTGSCEVRPGDMLLVYSDGAADCMFKKDGDINGEVADRIRIHDLVGLETFCRENVKSEGTLVYYI